MNEELKVIISAEISKLKSGIEDARKKISGFRDKVDKYSEDIDKDFENIGNSITNGLKAAGAAVVGAGAGLVALSGTTAEYRTEQAKLATAFEAAGSNAKQAKTTYNDLYRVLGDGGQATEAANHLAKLTTEEKALNEWTTICQGVYATFGDSLPIEGLTEAANETAKVGTLTGSLADALNWAGINEDAFNESLAACNTEAEREALIRETLNGLYTDAAEKFETNNAAMLTQNEAQAKLSENLATVGGALQPVLTALTSLAADCLEVITPYIQSFIDNYLPDIVSLLGNVAGVLETALNWMKEHQTLLVVLASVIGTITAAITAYNTVQAIKSALDIKEALTVGTLTAALWAKVAAIYAAIAPYILIVAAIAAVIAIIVLCVKHWDKIKEVITKVAKIVWEKVKEMATKVIEWFGNMKEKITESISSAKEAVVNKFNEITSGIKQKAQDAYNSAKEKFSNLKNSISNSIEFAKSAVSTKFNNIASTIGTKATEAFNKTKEKFSSIKDSIKNSIEDAKKAVSDKIAEIKEKLGLKGFSWKLPKPSFPKFKVSGGEAPWGFMGQGSLPKISISWNALGGVFDKPTVFGYGGSLQGIGEAGAEAVVPLENNLGWLDKLAGMLNERMGGNRPIVLTVDGKVFAQTSIDSINQLTRQTGALGLNLV